MWEHLKQEQKEKYKTLITNFASLSEAFSQKAEADEKNSTEDFVNNEADAYKKIYEEYDGNLEVITDKQYASLIRKKKSKEFYMLSINR